MNKWLKAVGAVAIIVASKVAEATAHGYLNGIISEITKEQSRKTYKS